jgi:thiol:disulfide interchange protein
MPRRRPRFTLSALLALGLAAAGAAAAAPGPFGVTARAGLPKEDGWVDVRVTFAVPAGHYLYAGDLTVTNVAGGPLEALPRPPATRHVDEFFGTVEIYEQNAVLPFRAQATGFPLTIEAAWMGCRKQPAACFPPGTRRMRMEAPGSEAVDATAAAPAPTGAVAVAAASDDGRALARRFEVAGRESGYLGREALFAFLDRVEAGKPDENPLAGVLRDGGTLLLLLAVLLGGLALNLTPCVLPMIPINIAIIGAGARAGSRARGFALGAAYGGAIAFVYGALGLAVVLTGSRFGTLNSSPWFNFGIAALFAVLACAMFGLFNIDLSRWQGGAGGPARHGGFATAVLFGAVAALLAGACVAPAVISVLLLAGDLYNRGEVAGLLLPFVLGLGMALPWPFAGAGLSFLPKPGPWMDKVKYAFGVLILLFALYYGKLGADLLRRAPAADVARDDWAEPLKGALRESLATGRPVFVDFWATWCKNCLLMEETTFRDSAVSNRLAQYVVFKFQAEDMNAPAIKPALDHFGVLGLPTYVVLQPKRAADGAP